MSKTSKSRVSFGVPEKGGKSKSTCGASKGSKTCLKAAEASRKAKFNIPALSIPPKMPPIDPVLEKLKKKTIRRNAPEGEDLKKIKDVIRGLHNEVITVQEFVGLISPYTGDHGHILRTVMGDDLSGFRKMAKRVYDTMTQDVSDVLANEQIHLTDYYNERRTLFEDKMMRTINAIFQYVPNFDFGLYYQDPEGYLNKLFPLSPDLKIDPEEEEMQRRQEAYHRLQWLRSEGERLGEENNQLQARLKELKKQQQEELIKAREEEEMAEEQKTHLEATQADLQNQLQELNESIEKTLIQTEEEMRVTQDGEVKRRLSRKQLEKKRPKTEVKKPRGEPWNVETAKILEEQSLVETTTSAISSVSVVSTPSNTGAKKKKPIKPKVKIKRPPPQPREKSPFHFSPIKTPPKPQERERSPFHYSPPKSPPRVKTETSSTVIEQAPQARQLPAARRSLSPRDSWGGF